MVVWTAVLLLAALALLGGLRLIRPVLSGYVRTAAALIIGGLSHLMESAVSLNAELVKLAPGQSAFWLWSWSGS
ncbi:hypothetical protein [Gorillibacterium sp. sgz5001074]|uniref:hypothetical protein n=1 Tax=Gorillibacterium sp. sgz5001074 TaxID=3446695 RepID=UPI003F67461D